MNKVLLHLLLTISLFACSEAKELDFANDGIQFTLPIGWFVKSKQEVVAGTEVIVLQYGKYIPKGLFAITVFEGQKDGRSVIDIYKADMQLKQVGPIDSKSIFGETEASSFGSYETLSADYEMTILSGETKGVVHVINDSNKTVVLLLQSFTGREQLFDEGIQMLESTLQILD